MLSSFNNLKEKESFFSCIQIDKKEDLLSFLEEIKDRNSFVFRGVKEAKFKCYTSAQVNTNGNCTQLEFDGIIEDMILKTRNNKKIRKIIDKRSKDNTDIQYLSLLQHFGFGTTILDFSYNFNSSVFFALDGLSYKGIDKEEINNYFSIYIFDKNNPNHTSIQEIMSQSLLSLKACDSEGRSTYGSLYGGLSSQTMKSYQNIPYKEIKDIARSGITIEGRYGGAIIIDENSIGLHSTYDISNERLDKQFGLFKLCTSNSLSWEAAALNWYSGMKDLIYCININKALADDLKERFLNPYNINVNTIYPNNKESRRILWLLMGIPFDGRLRISKKPSNMHNGTWKKIQKLYNKRMFEAKRKNKKN